MTHLFIELNVDGDADSAIRAVAATARQPLAALLATCCGLHCRDREALAQHLLDHVIELQPERPNPGPGRANGLNFHGTPGFSVQRIEAEAALAASAREHAATFMAQHRPQDNLGTSVLAHVREALRKEGHGDALDRPASLQPAFANWIQPTEWQALLSFLRQPPVIALVLGLVALGLATRSLKYARTIARVRRSPPCRRAGQVASPTLVRRAALTCWTSGATAAVSSCRGKRRCAFWRGSKSPGPDFVNRFAPRFL